MIEIVTFTMGLYRYRPADAPLKCDACGQVFENGDDTYKLIWYSAQHEWKTRYYQNLVCKDPSICYATCMNNYLWDSKIFEG